MGGLAASLGDMGSALLALLSAQAVQGPGGGNDIARWVDVARALIDCVGLALFVQPMEARRPRAAARAVAFALLCAAVLAVRLRGLRFFLDMPARVALFALFVRFDTRASWGNAVYAGIVAFLCGDLSVAVCNSVYRHAPTFAGPAGPILVECLYAALMLGLCALVRRWAPRRPESPVQPAGFAALLLALLPYILLRSSDLLYSAAGSDAITMEGLLLLTIVATFGAVLGNYSAALAEAERVRRLQLEMEMRERQRRYEVRRETMAEVNRRYHDMVKYARTLSEAGAVPATDERLVERMRQGLSEASLSAETGCQVLDAVLWERGEKCRELGIVLAPQVDVGAGDLALLDAFDLHAMVANALDNAIEAAAKVADPDKREIRFKLSLVGRMLFLSVENSYEGELRREGGREGGRLLSTKPDSDGAHGHGLENIRRTAKRCGGSAAVDARGGRFRLTVMVPLPDGASAA